MSDEQSFATSLQLTGPTNFLDVKRLRRDACIRDACARKGSVDL